ncbi:ABC-three component system middle component 2 [Vallitalea guaymasensis]|uniref:ABC-three component system middle component 2 n=1 Tax=Vallitalea guaymasensis TaxID=1185412 RepID=UPI0023565C53|nr:ABC-three component system middle component 2 [Vallitalea guaymasensis]
MKKNRLFNTEIETSIRLLTVISQIDGCVDLQKLIYMDFLILHYGNIDKKSVSLHPANPYHVTEIFSRRELIKSSVSILLKKGLIDLHMSDKGIEYSRNGLSNPFLKLFDSDYFLELKENVEIVVSNYGNYTTTDLTNFIKNNIYTWEDEFKYEVAFRGGDANE